MSKQTELNTNPSRPRNLLLVMVDDLNLALGCYGYKAVHSPNIDSLARRGLRFSHAFCPYPLCGPSRSALLSGRRPESFPMPNNEISWRDAAPELRTLPQIARESGWRTAGFGKLFHHGISMADLEPWKAAHPDARLPHTFDDPLSWDEYNCPKAQVHERLARGVEQLIDGQPFGGTSLHTVRVDNPDVLPDVHVANNAVRFLENLSQEGSQPFFLGVGFHKPHLPFVAPEKWWACYDNLDVEALVPPTWFHPAELPKGTLKRPGFHRGADEEQRRHLYKGYLACVSHMDDQLGRVLAALQRSGHADNTVVCFVADHGYHIGEQGQWDKMMPLDPATRVPMILAGPGIPEGRNCDALVESLDLFPTFCGLLDLEPDQQFDGKDLRPWIVDPGVPTSSPVYAWVEEGTRRCWTIRTETHRYGITSWQGGDPEPFLFDMVNDPDESRNLAEDADHEEMSTKLDRQLRQHFATTRAIPSDPIV